MENKIDKKRLLIIGAGIYGLVAKEIADSLCCFEKISFIDDYASTALDGSEVLGKSNCIDKFLTCFDNVVVAIGNPEVRMKMIAMLEKKECNIVSLISPKAYISPSAIIEPGCIIEPMSVVQSKCVIKKGAIISAGAVINHASTLNEGVHIDCNATVSGQAEVQAGIKVSAGKVFE